MSGESDAMLQRMLVHVLAMERGDAFVIAPGGCAACAELARRQVALVAPRAVLVMGDVAARVTRVPYGKWGRWTDLDALATHHPDAIVAKPELKAPVFEHLKDVARRV
jgi:uracil-DNA glycosylase